MGQFETSAFPPTTPSPTSFTGQPCGHQTFWISKHSAGFVFSKRLLLHYTAGIWQRNFCFRNAVNVFHVDSIGNKRRIFSGVMWVGWLICPYICPLLEFDTKQKDREGNILSRRAICGWQKSKARFPRLSRVWSTLLSRTVAGNRAYKKVWRSRLIIDRW